MIDENKLIETLRASLNTGSETFPVELIVECVEEQPKVGNWISVSNALPAVEDEVLIITEKGIITTAIYEDGTVEEGNSTWFWIDIDFNYDEETDTNYIPRGWWEYKHFNRDEEYNNGVDDRVIAWMPLPEPYKEIEK